jgi:hypothetical protein
MGNLFSRCGQQQEQKSTHENVRQIHRNRRELTATAQGYRWAHERGVKVDGSKEPEPLTWIAEYGKEPAKP